MSRYLPEPHNGLLPGRIGAGRQLGRCLDRMDAQALALQHADHLAIGRAVSATERGMVGIATISLREAALIRAVPHAEPRLRAAADNGSAVILSRILEAGL